jgi:hypothetical protein
MQLTILEQTTKDVLIGEIQAGEPKTFTVNLDGADVGDHVTVAINPFPESAGAESTDIHVGQPQMVSLGVAQVTILNASAGVVNMGNPSVSAQCIKVS